MHDFPLWALAAIIGILVYAFASPSVGLVFLVVAVVLLVVQLVQGRAGRL